jgi:hypothetical protein
MQAWILVPFHPWEALVLPATIAAFGDRTLTLAIPSAQLAKTLGEEVPREILAPGQRYRVQVECAAGERTMLETTMHSFEDDEDGSSPATLRATFHVQSPVFDFWLLERPAPI